MGTRKRRQRQEALWYRSEIAEAPGHLWFAKNRSGRRENSPIHGCDLLVFVPIPSPVGQWSSGRRTREPGLAAPTWRIPAKAKAADIDGMDRLFWIGLSRVWAD
jgi:hypothetical protein